jgi:hypothetical protein
MSDTKWKLVPVEPTKEMLAAFKSAFAQGSIWTDRISHACAAMLDAAPIAPTADVQPVAWVDEKAEVLMFGGWDKRPFAKSYRPVFYAAPSPKPAVEAGAQKLDKPAQVQHTVFRPGVSWSTVIGAAQRHYEYRHDESMPKSFPDRYNIREIDALKMFGVDQSGRQFVDYREYLALQRELDAIKAASPPSAGPAPLPEATRNSMGKPSEGELRWLWTQARATMPEGMCGFNEARHLVDMLFPYAAPPAASAQKGLTDGQIAALVNRFLIWQIPQTVASDLCVTDSTYQFPRSGTNLLNAVEAEAMLRYVLAALLRESEGK